MSMEFFIVNIDSDVNIKRLIEEFNRLQSSFVLKLETNNFRDDSKVFNREKFFDHYSEIKKPIIGITKRRLDNNWFSDVSSDYSVAIVSTYQSKI